MGWWRDGAEDEVALRDELGALTWRELDDMLNRSINALLEHELGADRRVAVYAENSVAAVVAYLTGILAGCSVVPINYHLRPEECAYILKDSGTALLFAGPENVDRALEAVAAVGGLPIVAWDTAPRAGLTTWDEFVAAGDPGEPPDDLPPLPYLHYTSGTTGFPKGTKTPPGLYPGSESPTLREHVEALVAVTPRDEGPQLTIAPLYHSGQLYPVKIAVLAGRTLVVSRRRFDAEEFLRTVERHRVGRVQMVPTHFVRLLALHEETRAKYDVSSLRMVSHSAAACPVDVKRRMIEWLGPILYEGYGATEQGVVSSITSEEWLAHPGSVGRVRAGLELLVIGENGEELGPNQAGRLYIRDMSGFDVEFHNDAEKTASVHLGPGVFTIGEIGYVDEEGYLYLTDRFSDTVISGGVNIFPAEAEQAMMDLPGVEDVACIGVPDPDLGEVLKALVVPADLQSPPSPDALLDGVRKRLTKHKCPRSVELVTDIGRNALGKINKHELRERYARGELIAVGAADED
jgi:acyl-CoA synthetase (AMP-forming)/AMP-acid ligase II